MIFKRNCPSCKEEIEYTNKRSWYNANKANCNCKKCGYENASKTLLKKVKDGTYIPNIRPKNENVTYKYFRTCPNCNKEIGYTRKDIMVSSEKRNTMCNSCSTYKYNKTFKDVVTDSHIKQMRATKAGFDNWEDYVENYPKKQFYKREVWRLTYKQPIQTLENWGLRGRCGVEGAYQLDHIKSIDWGWRNNIPAEEIARWDNLRMIPWKTNLLKSNITH